MNMTHLQVIVTNRGGFQPAADGRWWSLLDAIAEKTKRGAAIQRLAENVWMLPLPAVSTDGAILFQAVAESGLDKKIMICAEASQAIRDQWQIP